MKFFNLCFASFQKQNSQLRISVKTGLLISVAIISCISTEANTQKHFVQPTIQQQVQKISGKITDKNGNAIAGATINIKETGRAFITDSNGNFSIQLSAKEKTLIISYIGLKKQIIEINGRSVINVTLDEDVAELKEVTVLSTGYQTISKERATGSFDVISKEQLDKPTTNIATRLIGTVAGLQAKLDVDGNPTDIQIRGLSSLYATATPLVVVDGFAIQGDFNSINPNDVESISVLKDAAAASIWGARSANGVIVVTTKKANKSTPIKVEFSTFTRIGNKLDLSYVNPLASSAETVEYEKQAFNKWGGMVNNGSLTTNYAKSWSQATVALSEHYLGFTTDAQLDATLAQLKTQDNRSQISDNLLATPVNTQYNLSLYGSSGKLTNALSLLYESNQSNFKETYNNKYLINYRTSANLSKWLTVNFSALTQYIINKNNGVTLSDIQSLSPYDMLKNSDGSLTNISQYYWPIIQRYVPTSRFPYSNWTYNPIQEIQNRDITSKQLNARIQAGLTFNIIRGLTFDTKIQYEFFNTFNRNLYNENTYYVRNTINTASTWSPQTMTGTITTNLPKGSILTQNRAQYESYNLRNQLNFDRIFFRKHEINFVAGSEIISNISQTFNNPITYGYNDDKLTVGTFPNGSGGTFYPIKNWMGNNQTFSYTNSFSYTTDRYFSLYGNLAYTYDNKYTLSGSARTDASNLITDDPKYRYAPFWSVGLSWQAQKEEFLKNISWLNRLNLRLTYGYRGNVDKSTAFKPLISLGTTPNIYTNDYTASISSYGNPTLRWEKTGSLNLGFNYAVLGGKLYGKLDVYNDVKKDLIVSVSIPAVNGTTSQKLNNGTMNNRGINFEVGSFLNIKENDIVWRGSLNFSYNRNRITKLFIATYAASSLTSGPTYSYVQGNDANALWSFVYAGVVNNQPTVKGANGTTYEFNAWTPGDGRDYMINSGTTNAPYGLGVTNSFKIYDFNVSFIITGKFGHVFKVESFNYPVVWGSRVLPNDKLSTVTNGDQSQIVPLPLNANEAKFYFWDRFYPYLSYLVKDASNIRIQELNVTYNLNQSLLRRFKINKTQIYAQGNDLHTFLFNKEGEDPEYPKGTLKPQPKFTLGLKFEF